MYFCVLLITKHVALLLAPPSVSKTGDEVLDYVSIWQQHARTIGFMSHKPQEVFKPCCLIYILYKAWQLP